MSIYYVGSLAYDSDYLAHFGIIGQKWGVRRYQNDDGTLTDAGKKRYAKDLKKLNSIHKNENKQLQRVEKADKRAYKAKYGKFSSANKSFKADKKLHEERYTYERYVNKGKKMSAVIQKRYANVKVSELNNVKETIPVKYRKYL